MQINDFRANTGIDANINEDNDDENEEENNKYNVNNNDVSLDDDIGETIKKYGPIEYD